MTRTDLRVCFEIPDYWTPEQALAVYELLDSLRECILSRYHAQITDAYREQCMPILSASGSVLMSVKGQAHRQVVG
jgi:hypothetical protein